MLLPSEKSSLDGNYLLLTLAVQGQFAIYGDIKKALGATGGVEIAKT